MKSLIYHISFLIVSISFFSCETIIEYELPENNPKMVLNGYFSNDSIWEIKIFESKNILESGDFKFVPGAIVEISDQNNNVIPLTYVGFGKYVSLDDLKPQLNNSYNIKATQVNFDAVNSEALLPKEVPIISIDTNTIIENGYAELENRITFLDPSNQKNYYSLNILFDQVTAYQYDSLFKDTFSQSYPLYYYSNEISFTDTWVYTKEGIVFSDDFFDGNEYQLSVISEKPYIYEFPPFEVVLSASITYELQSISEEVYLYRKSLADQQFASFDPFAQPVQVFNNINGGFGIFGGITSSSKTITLK